jgi:hypothetical protein
MVGSAEGRDAKCSIAATPPAPAATTAPTVTVAVITEAACEIALPALATPADIALPIALAPPLDAP